MECFDKLKGAPRRIALPDVPTPTSFELTKSFYKRAEDIVTTAGKMLSKNIDVSSIIENRKFPHDIPGNWFKGPF